MKKPDLKYLNTMLAFGMFLMFAGILVLLGFFGKNEDILGTVLSVVVMLAGLVFLYVYIAFSRTPFKLFAGLALFFNGLFLFLIAINIFSLGFKKLWPFMILIVSLSIFASSRTKKKRFSLSYDFTAVLLFAIGIFLLLFSLGVIKHTFGEVMLILLPVIFILSGFLLVFLFFKRKSLIKMMPEKFSERFEDEENFEDDDGEEL